MKLTLAAAIYLVLPLTCFARPVKRASSNGKISDIYFPKLERTEHVGLR